MTNALATSLLAPRRIALVGASSDPTRLTARAQIYLRKHGYTGALFPVNPRADSVLNEKAYPGLRDIPGEIDLAYILVGTQHVEAAIADCAARGVPVAAILADGFAETGAEGAERQARLLDAARAGGLRLLGPNSMGVINIPAATACSVNAALEAERLLPGRWSLISQSGSVMGALASRANARGFGFAKMVGMGNEVDLTAGEVADLLVDDPDTDAILLFLETIRRPEFYERAARRAHALGKPIIAYKLGRSEAGAKLAATHTGAMAGSDAAADAFLRALGIVRVTEIEALLELPPLLIGRRPPAAPKRSVRVVTTTGGGGAMVVDRLGLAGVATAHMLDTTLAGMGNVAKALSDARSADDTDVAIAVIGSSAQFRPQDAVSGVLQAEGPHPICAFLAPQADQSLRLLAAAGIAAFDAGILCGRSARLYRMAGTAPTGRHQRSVRGGRVAAPGSRRAWCARSIRGPGCAGQRNAHRSRGAARAGLPRGLEGGISRNRAQDRGWRGRAQCPGCGRVTRYGAGDARPAGRAHQRLHRAADGQWRGGGDPRLPT